ncbi:glycoside hydrolase family 3 C-terminal domain-containing protein [Streptomyces sp. NPDC051561]|uniref:glycoside hydrolase family 3 C-terminal domain-containing protein n=1 Tax=Streptomyces sp. NPDC051561 TaxID=3365658 RepID=UPI0037B87F11
MVPGVSRRDALRGLGGALLAATAGGVPMAVAADRGRPGGADGGRFSARVEGLLARLTRAEKLMLVHGSTDPTGARPIGFTAGVERLGIPPLRFTDGPAGVRLRRGRASTALPAPVMLAASFDPRLADAYGTVLGQEGRAFGADVVLAPMVNLMRTPYAGRNFETFSEDPLLTAQIAAAEIQGIQAQGAVAAVKHLALNNQEADRLTVDVEIEEQPLREMELRGFEAAVAAGVGVVMGSYNKVRGSYACENRPLLTDLLRGEWGFTGWVVSDWGATHSTAQAITAGLDMEMPGSTHFGAALGRAIADGSVPEAALDTAVGRILSVQERFHLLDEWPPGRPDHDAASGARTALDVARAGATLLHNPHATLPLSDERATSLALIGPTALRPFVSGGGSAYVDPAHADSPETVFRERGAQVRTALGENIYGHPLVAPSTSLDDLRVPARETRTMHALITVPQAGTWTWVLHHSGAAPHLLVDGVDPFRPVPGSEFAVGGLLRTAPGGFVLRRCTTELTAGTHRIDLTANGGAQGQQVRLRHLSESTRAADLAEAVSAARAASTAVVFAYEDATEGHDRTTLNLPGNQNTLISAVAATGTPTVVVLNASGAVAMPWLDEVAAALHMYYPGQEGARATAEVLCGDIDPGGRLTQSFPTDDDSHATAQDPGRYPGTGSTVTYSEGILAGHRWHTATGTAPLFPFGHGLSYTTFEHADLTAEAERDGSLTVRFTVTNTGDRPGVTVPQVYLGPSPDLTANQIGQPPRILAGYRRVSLRPGRSKNVTVKVAPRQLSSWSTARRAWVLGTGSRSLWIADSAEDLRLAGTVVLGAAGGPAQGGRGLGFGGSQGSSGAEPKVTLNLH